jgi:hypothetical protein
MKYFALVALLVARFCSAGTYFIDRDSGSDANAGTSAAAAWENHPYMTGWTGSYAHSSGDRFIFKGGVTWPSNCWPMTVTAGGSAASWDYYGTTNNWYSGGEWSRPIFDGGYVLQGSMVSN